MASPDGAWDCPFHVFLVQMAACSAFLFIKYLLNNSKAFSSKTLENKPSIFHGLGVREISVMLMYSSERFGCPSEKFIYFFKRQQHLLAQCRFPAVFIKKEDSFSLAFLQSDSRSTAPGAQGKESNNRPFH